MKKILVLLLLTTSSFLGCGLNPDPSSLKQYHVTIITPTGEIYKKHLVVSTGLPNITYNEEGAHYWEYVINTWKLRRYPIGWLIKSEIIVEKE